MVLIVLTALPEFFGALPVAHTEAYLAQQLDLKCYF